MSTANPTVSYSPGADAAAKSGSPLKWIARASPKEGWDCFVLLVAAIGVSAWTVREANWVPTPGLYWVLVLSALTALGLAKLKVWWPLLLIAGGLIGVSVAAWNAATLVVGKDLVLGFVDVWDRTYAWLDAARTGRINTDLLPSTLYLLLIAWTLGFTSSWFLFRYSNVWIGLVLSGVAILTTLSFLPDNYAPRFFIFLFISIVLVARVSWVQQQERWRRARVGVVPNVAVRWFSLPMLMVVSALLLTLAAVMPLRAYVWNTAVSVWNTGREPITGLEDDFSRLFSGIASKKDLNGRFFGDTLPFQGKMSFGGDIVMVTASELPAYWLSRTYDTYSSQGWVASPTKKTLVGPQGLPPPPHESSRRELAFQTVVLTFASEELFSGGNVDWVSHNAIVETLPPKEFTIKIHDPSGDGALPEDVREIARDIRNRLVSPPSRFVESLVIEVLPADLQLVKVTPGSDAKDWTRQETVTIARKEPQVPDVVAWRFDGELPAQTPYTMYSYVSNVMNLELREAGENYPHTITDRYLQLPASLPQRVKDLAAQVAAGAETPLDKALAIESYLRETGGLTYSQDISAPPMGADGVDHFLFATKTGYSDYFASAMTVMARSVGVPARMAAGYAPGVAGVNPNERIVKDSDSHGWVQVYFPGHGWLDFEPTTHWPQINRGPVSALAERAPEEGRPQTLPNPSTSIGSGQPEWMENCLLGPNDFIEDIVDPAQCLTPEEFAELQNSLEGDQAAGIQLADMARPLAIMLAMIAAVWMAGWLMWTRGLGKATPAERAYIKMGRLGAIAGIRRRPHQTPMEYARSMGILLPGASAPATTVAVSYAAGRYGPKAAARTADQIGIGGIDMEQSDKARELNGHWKAIRRSLLGRMIKRMVPRRPATAKPAST
ncbi:MAG: hypothetical protein FJ319_01065 [SAR202 cluster bacterium]|nr:hypothetical protein [SAR202 cluster bacterium]